MSFFEIEASDWLDLHNVYVLNRFPHRIWIFFAISSYPFLTWHRLRTAREEITFTAWLKTHSHSQIFRHSQSLFCLPHRPKFSGIFDLWLHWVSVWHGMDPDSLSNRILSLEMNSMIAVEAYSYLYYKRAFLLNRFILFSILHDWLHILLFLCFYPVCLIDILVYYQRPIWNECYSYTIIME